MKRLLFIALAVPATASAADLRTVPVRYQGHWASSAEQCTANLADDTNVRVGAGFIHDYTGRMTVLSVTPQGNTMIIASIRLGTGKDAYENAKRLELLEKGTVLAVGEGEDHSTYVRCKS